MLYQEGRTDMLRTLIVDDSKTELDVLLFLIKKYSLPLCASTAFNGEEALAILEKESFQLLITDIKMPFMDGLSLAKEAIRLQPHIKIIISSGYQDFTYAKTAISLGVKEYLLKPVNPSEFTGLIARLSKDAEAEQERISQNRVTVLYSRDQITQQLIEGKLRPEKDGLLSPKVRAIMPASCLLFLISADKTELTMLQNLKQEIIRLADQFFGYPARCISSAAGLFLSIDSAEPICADSKEILQSHADRFAERLHEMYRLHFRVLPPPTACAVPPESIYELARLLIQQASCAGCGTPDDENTAPSGLASSHGKVRMVCDYIASHYQEELSLEILSDIAYVHPDYLSRIFKKETGMNLNRYIKTFRMNKACQLLLDTQQKVSSISTAVGYQNCPYFIRTFTDTFGISPERYRQEHHARREENGRDSF